ncbi:unnamed protein product [Rotaria socialis]|uniref:Trichohyalin-plectin-homology domain-containing protein n=1 Tax=Rotaria socialis TaxID=392032 RepID=A0A817Q3N2_9BILA|nr:unnamed protein product [Rotaria socialis]CAF3371668.1 unnamed protein product [Rotaria socialis]CAF3391792.1 unnamed protein product [Rotaria socialis]CAF3598054.1 unnamed protein product [Rotaria socialis]CAF3610913.1 unnamed protein product [Rotaria socialis]
MVIKTLPVPSTKPPGNNPLASKRRPLHSLSASCPPDNRLEQHHLPDAADLRRMCIITKTDLNRIYDNLDRRQRDKDAVRQEIERKKEMADRSAQITKQWPNTIIGARERKIEMKKIRDQEDEDKRKVVDLEEEKLAAERRREHIEKAKQLQYYQTDRVRTFHSALLFTEVLKERDLQLEMKKRIEKMRETDENEEHQRYQEAQNEFYKAEQEKMERKLKDQENLAKYHRAQMDQRKSQFVQEKQQDLKEGDEYRRLAEQYSLEQFELDRFKKLTQKDVKSMYDKALEDKRTVKQMEEALDEEEDDELRVYAEAKKKMARLRREKEVQAHQEKQEARDHMIGYLGSLQKRAESDNDAQIFRAQAQREAKELREKQEKFEKQQKMQESIRKHRFETTKRREVEREMEEREDVEIRRKKAEADRLFLLYQQEKDKQRHEDALVTSQYHLKQAQERKDRQRDMKASELEEVLLDKHMNEVEKQQYQDYTGRVIAYMDENGRNTYPMRRAVADEVQRFDQLNQGINKAESQTNENGEKKPGSQDKKSLEETKKHLGFQWDIPNK